MKKNIYYLTILAFFLCSCSKKDNAVLVDPKDNYSYFLNNTTPIFSGKLNDNSFSWSFGLSKFQKISGYENGNGICDSTDPVRVFQFGLISEDMGKTYFRLYTPKYNSTSDSAINNIFSLGIKKLGAYRENFYLSININNVFYQSVGNSKISEIEILKTAEFDDPFNSNIKNLRVWFRIDTKLSSCGCGETNATLSNGLMTAAFWNYKKRPPGGF